MDLQKLNRLCAEIARKTRPFVKKDAQFTEKELRLVEAHAQLWWAHMEDAFGVTDE